MIAGRKLLLIDDSPAIQKVIDLTFTDEGMQVTTVGDGRRALEELEHVAPDVVLADVFMPGVDGYQICESIKQHERFAGIPVMLLVGSFEPFDEAEARRVGADDVVTKPFQSIRQLVSRVGSLLGGKAADAEDTTHEYSTLGLARSDAAAPAAPGNHAMADTNVKVFVEAASMTDHDLIEVAGEAAGSTCAADVELQTADTMKLHRVDVEPATAETEPMANLQQTAIETEPVIARQQMAQPEISAASGDAFLDLGEFDSAPPAATAESFVLDLEDEISTQIAEPLSVAPIAETPAPVVEAVVAAEPVADEAAQEVEAIPATVESQEWEMVAAPAVEEVAEPAIIEESLASSTPSQVNLSDLSPEIIDAIARRAVEQLSERVVREIAWEVVPELAESLIKHKFEKK